MLYDASLVKVTGAITIGSQFPNVISGNSLTIGVLDEVGGTAGQEVTGGGSLLLFRQSLTATATGTADFYNNPADASAHQTLLYFNANTTPTQNSDFVGMSLTIARSAWQNPGNPLDVDGDGSVVPLDVLMIINELNSFGPHELSSERPLSAPYLDVNGDRFISPVDALAVINDLNSRSGAEGEARLPVFASAVVRGESANQTAPLKIPQPAATSRTESTVAKDAFFAALDDETLEHWIGRYHDRSKIGIKAR